MSLIYIVEDDSGIREIEMIALQNSGYEVVVFSNAKDFYKRLEDVLPDLLLLDIMLPDSDGNEIVKKLRSRPETRKIPIIMVTAKTSELDLIKGLDGGADDYVKKPFSVMELITRVKALIRRTQSDDIQVLRFDELVIDHIRHEILVNKEVIDLTFKEYELLRYLAVNAGIVVTRDMIMENVWQTDFEGESRTVDMHIKTLRKKLGISGERIKTIRNVGYMFE